MQATLEMQNEPHVAAPRLTTLLTMRESNRTRHPPASWRRFDIAYEQNYPRLISNCHFERISRSGANSKPLAQPGHETTNNSVSSGTGAATSGTAAATCAACLAKVATDSAVTRCDRGETASGPAISGRTRGDDRPLRSVCARFVSNVSAIGSRANLRSPTPFEISSLANCNDLAVN